MAIADPETLLAFVLCFVLIKISSIRTGKFNIPHKLLNGLKVVIPSAESLNNLNETKKEFKRTKKKNKGVPIVRKYKTVNDRVEALQYEVENVESGMFIGYSCWEEYDNLMLFSLCCVVGFVVIEGWRLVEYQVAINPAKIGSCSVDAQMRVMTDQAKNSSSLFFGYFMLFMISDAGRFPHTYMYEMVQNWALGFLVAFFFFMYMHTPALMNHVGLPLDQVADDIAVRFALWLRLVDNTSTRSDYVAENGGLYVKVAMSFYVAYLVAGFGHSLSQLSRVTTYVLNSKKGEVTPDKIIVGVTAVLPILIVLTYFFNAGLSKMMVTIKVSPSIIRAILALFWASNNIMLVPRHLQFYMQQGFKDSVKDLSNHSVNAQRVRMHFQKRVTLVIYSACQYCCFPLFIVMYLLYTGHKTGMGKLGHARPFQFGSFEAGPDHPVVLSRSTIYDKMQEGLAHCKVPSHGSYPDELDGYEIKDSSVMWEENKDLIKFSLKDMWDDVDNFRAVMMEIPYARRIVFSKDEFDDSLLMTKSDQKKARELKEFKDKARNVLFPLINHTIISPPFFAVWFECLGVVACFLWSMVYLVGIIKHIKNKEMIEYEFSTEITEDNGEGKRTDGKKQQ